MLVVLALLNLIKIVKKQKNVKTTSIQLHASSFKTKHVQ